MSDHEILRMIALVVLASIVAVIGNEYQKVKRSK